MKKVSQITIYLIISLFFCATYATTTTEGLVVTSQHLATKVGTDILNKGGNAIDAAAAVGYALSVVEPCCGNLGGGGFMLIRFANGQTTFLNFREKAPLLAKTALYLDKEGKPVNDRIERGYLSVGVPGTVMGLNTALEKYGTMPLTQVIEPAIKLASEGFVLVPDDVELLHRNWPKLKSQPNVAEIFGKDERPLQVGDRLIQKNLANTLRYIAKHGTKGFYQGAIAHKIVKESALKGGIFSLEDFTKYTVEFLKPLTCQYRGYDIISAPPPSSGGVVLCEILNITSGYPLKALGYRHPLGTHYILEAMRFAYADRTRLGDPDFITNPTEKLLSAQHASRIRRLIKPNEAGHSALVIKNLGQEKPQTTHYSIVDKYGNAVAVTYTINGNFGAKVIAGDTGFFLNNEMDDFALTPTTPNQFELIQGKSNQIEPQKRPLSSMTPTIVLKNQKLFMVLGTPGGSTIPTQVLEVIENVIDYNMSLKKAVDAPRFHMQWMPDLVYMEAGAFSLATLTTLKQMGYHFKLGSPFGTPKWGTVAAILRDPQSGKLFSAVG